VEMLAHNRAVLEDYYRLTEADDAISLALLDKEQTHLLAVKSGVEAPQVRRLTSPGDLQIVAQTTRFPCALKPIHSHLFQRHFSEKAFIAHNQSDLEQAFSRAERAGVAVLLTELVPGGDDLYCSYYAYIDERGEPLFEFTKRKPRQYPIGFGIGTYHITDWNPEVAEMGLRFLRGAGVRGLANVEFKRDPRDGRLKLIECNARFTLVHDLLEASGIPVAEIVYSRLTGRSLPQFGHYRRGMSAVRPWLDFQAFRQYRRCGALSLGEWLRSVLRPGRLLVFSWDDPLPALVASWRFWKTQLQRRVLRQRAPQVPS
jgi:D-aspartate ligase